MDQIDADIIALEVKRSRLAEDLELEDARKKVILKKSLKLTSILAFGAILGWVYSMYGLNATISVAANTMFFVAIVRTINNIRSGREMFDYQ